ncbi:hypothetical protein CFIMG_003500RA [Ceratocystis fimbriata CBS 114723]|uniref:Uncharacterized protein n=1 Tax=Ceratocystis fimbriata CBS 114723 TaxID=1035309 RepID=A0A2C5X7Z1_9PEZI|nr:hypothetical protein CFIMG_003500RA [Ceratocystis fimbriata CBS 114723]
MAQSPILRWFNRKMYQIEVSFAVNMWTPFERFLFYSVLFLGLSLLSLATLLYLPQHIKFLVNRAWFYAHGDEASDIVTLAKTAAQTVVNVATAGAGSVAKSEL